MQMHDINVKLLFPFPLRDDCLLCFNTKQTKQHTKKGKSKRESL